jgi:hypothetical protein
MTNNQPPPNKPQPSVNKPIRVTPTYNTQNTADLEATRGLIAMYTDKDGFHCPKCGMTTTDPQEAVLHLAEEINSALDVISQRTILKYPTTRDLPPSKTPRQ